MEWKDKRIGCAEARDIDMVTYLSVLGIEPSKIRGNNYWYLSPLRNEKTASFKINQKLNRWFDFGLGKGGNLVDFGILYYKCSVSDFLQSLKTANPLQLRAHIDCTLYISPKETIEILHVKKLTHPALLQYLQLRKIPPPIAGKFCSEVHFLLNGRRNFAIGFCNELGGYELRNVFFKGSSTPKGITHIRNGAEELAVFEGFTDFLTFIVLSGPDQTEPLDYLILNSTAFLEAALPIMPGYKRIFLYLDNDATGQNCSCTLMQYGNRFSNESIRYRNYKDLNDYLVDGGKSFTAPPIDNSEPP